MAKITIIAMALLLVVSGCATRSGNITADNISFYQYSELSCAEIGTKMSHMSTELTQLSKKQDNMATTDAVAMTVGLVLFWPALIVNAATPDHKADISKLKGEYQALETASAVKKCGAAGNNPRAFANN